MFCKNNGHIVPTSDSIISKEIKPWPSTSLKLTKIEIFRPKYRVLRHAQNKEA